MNKAVSFKVKAGETRQPLRRPGKKDRVYPFHTMAVDELIFVPDKEAVNFTTYVHKQARLLNRKFRTLGTWMKQDAKSLEWEACDPNDLGARRGVAVTRIA